MNEARSSNPSRAAIVAALALSAGLGGGFAVGRLTAPHDAGAHAPAPAAATGDAPVVVVARVGDETLTLSELDERWRQLSPAERAFHGARAKETQIASAREHFLGELAEEILLAREARRRGLDARADIRAAVRACGNRIVVRPLLAKEVRESALPRSEMEAWYAANSEHFGRPARVQIREILVTSTASGAGDTTTDAAAARAKADALRARLLAGEDFAAVATSESEAPSAQYGGLVGWVTAGRFARAWEATALILQQGDVSDVLEIPEGFAILRADAREEATIPPLEEVQDEILDHLLGDDEGALQRRYNVFVRELRQREPVELHPELLGRDASAPGAPTAAESVSPGGTSAPGR